MSVASMIRRQRTLATVYRGTASSSGDGSRYYGAPWTAETEIPVNIQDVGYERAQKSFGTQEVIAARGFVVAGHDVRADDRIVVTAGPFDGQAFRVVEVKSHRQGSGSDHLELALQSTTESVP